MLQAGDIIGMMGKVAMSQAVASFTHGEISHVALVVAVDPVALVLESVFHARTVPLDVAAAAHAPVYLLQHRELSQPRRRAIVERAYTLAVPSMNWVDKLVCFSPQVREILGQELSALNTEGYSFLRGLLVGLDRMTSSYFFTEHAPGSLDPMCSWLVAQAYNWVGYQFDRPPDSCTPQDILDHARRSALWQIGVMRENQKS